MAKTAVFIQPGEALDYQNMTEELIPANTVILLGKRIGVAGGDIPPAGLGAVHMTGVFELPKKAGTVLAAGDEVTFTEEDGVDKAEGGVAYAVEAAAAADPTAKIKLLG